MRLLRLCDLQAVLLLELEILLPEGVDAVNHDLDQLHLGVAETVLVGDVIGVACRKSNLIRFRLHKEKFFYNRRMKVFYNLPVWPPDSPLVPRGWTASSSHLAFSLSTPSLVQPGRSTCTEARMPVPRLVGQEWM